MPKVMTSFSVIDRYNRIIHTVDPPRYGRPPYNGHTTCHCGEYPQTESYVVYSHVAFILKATRSKMSFPGSFTLLSTFNCVIGCTSSGFLHIHNFWSTYISVQYIKCTKLVIVL